MLILRIMASLALVLSFAVAIPVPAKAEACTSVVSRDENGKVTVKIECSDDEESGGGGSSGKRVCMWDGVVVPCKNELGSWYSPSRCWISPVDPLPPYSDVMWHGHTDGALYYCRIAPGYLTGTPLIIWIGSATPPPDPEQLAREAVRQMQLRPITIGIAPNDDPDSVGLVGMPIWLWAADPDDQTMGPISRSASEGGFTVTATAKVEHVRWSMGDGGVKTCAGPGTPYELKYGIRESPTCGYRFDKQGEFTVTARSDWIVNWTGIGETGSFRVYLTQNTQVLIGELNVVTVRGRSWPR